MKPTLATFQEVEHLLRAIDQSHVYSNRGPLVKDLEVEYSKYLKVDKKLVVALSNATQAIQGLVSISKNLNWVVPDYTFAATGLAVLNTSKRLHICDVSLSDWKIDLELLEDDERSFGIIPVMPFGSEIDFSPYHDFDEVIIDAAASLGARTPDFTVMKKGWAVVYSLHATKVLGAGEGAIVICGDEKQAATLRAWSNFGFSSERIAKFVGTNAKMSEITAAYGLYSIQNIEREKKSWLESQISVATRAAKYPWMTFINSKPQFHPYWIASFGDKEEKNSVVNRLTEEGIQSRDWWPNPLSTQDAFAYSTILKSKGNARILSGIHLGLPMYRGLTPSSVNEICDLIESVLKMKK
jgi:dTDP-4-amino-4,6-dideoxygalactose transaminase